MQLLSLNLDMQRCFDLSSWLAQNEIRTFYDWAPMVPLVEWWHLLLALVAGLMLVGYILLMYRADSAELPMGLRFLLTALRIVAFTALVFFVLGPEKRSETRIVKTSRISLLVDTSLSMGLRDPAADGQQQSKRRIDGVIETLANNSTVNQLRQEHDVTIYRFDEQPQPVQLAVLKKFESAGPKQDQQQQLRDQAQAYLTDAVLLGRIGWAVLGFSLLVGVAYLSFRLQSEQTWASWMLATSVLSLHVAVALIGIAYAHASEFEWLAAVGISEPRESPRVETSTLPQNPAESAEDEASDAPAIDWQQEFSPTGTATRLSQAIEFVVNKERGGPMAGIVVVTDGGDNLGSNASRAAALAAEAGIPIFCVGIGSDRQPRNVRVDDLQAPPRVFPNDKFRIKAQLQATGMVGESATVRLMSMDEQGGEAEMVEAEETVSLLEDGILLPLEFEVSRAEEGRRRYVLRVDVANEDLDPRDNERSAMVEVIDRQTRVLVIAGGPMREFRFLRNQLYRDDDIYLSVWLQSAQAGADQESNELLTDFPATREEMYEYDCVIAFDPDWRELTAPQAQLLEKWIAEQAGGMVIVAGPVQTPEWTRRARGDEAIDLIRRVYPVSFYSQGSPTLKPGRFGGELAFPIQFTREGRAADFLWLGDNSLDSQENWDQFAGVYGYYAVHEQKAGADVLARFSDPDTVINDELPIYMASQFYGAGRVFFQASGEMWRLRSTDVAFFQDYYTQLIRWASQGRLLRDSQRGVLLADKQQCWVGDQVMVQAILRDSQDQPLVAEKVEAILRKPDGETERMTLLAAQDAVRAGTFTAQFTALIDGDYRISLAIPDSAEAEVLSTTVEAKIPDLEKSRPQRNDTLLLQLADKSGGKLYLGANELLRSRDDPDSLLALAGPQDQVTFLPGTPSREFARRLMMVLLTLVVLALGSEWLLRRLHRLA